MAQKNSYHKNSILHFVSWGLIDLLLILQYKFKVYLVCFDVYNFDVCTLCFVSTKFFVFLFFLNSLRWLDFNPLFNGDKLISGFHEFLWLNKCRLIIEKPMFFVIQVLINCWELTGFSSGLQWGEIVCHGSLFCKYFPGLSDVEWWDLKSVYGNYRRSSHIYVFFYP